MEDQETKQYIVKVTSTWLVDAIDEKEAIDTFTDGTMLDLQEVAELNEAQ